MIMVDKSRDSLSKYILSSKLTLNQSLPQNIIPLKRSLCKQIYPCKYEFLLCFTNLHA